MGVLAALDRVPHPGPIPHLPRLARLTVRVLELRLGRGEETGAERLAWERLPAGMWTVDRDLRITSASGSAFRGMGVDTRSFIEQSIADFARVSGQGEAPVERHRRAVAGEEVRYRTNLRGRTFDVRLEPLRESLRGAAGSGRGGPGRDR